MSALSLLDKIFLRGRSSWQAAEAVIRLLYVPAYLIRGGQMYVGCVQCPFLRRHVVPLGALAGDFTYPVYGNANQDFLSEPSRKSFMLISPVPRGNGFAWPSPSFQPIM